MDQVPLCCLPLTSSSTFANSFAVDFLVDMPSPFHWERPVIVLRAMLLLRCAFYINCPGFDVRIGPLIKLQPVKAKAALANKKLTEVGRTFSLNRARVYGIENPDQELLMSRCERVPVEAVTLAVVIRVKTIDIWHVELTHHPSLSRSTQTGWINTVSSGMTSSLSL